MHTKGLIDVKNSIVKWKTNTSYKIFYIHHTSFRYVTLSLKLRHPQALHLTFATDSSTPSPRNCDPNMLLGTASLKTQVCLSQVNGDRGDFDRVDATSAIQLLLEGVHHPIGHVDAHHAPGEDVRVGCSSDDSLGEEAGATSKVHPTQSTCIGCRRRRFDVPVHGPQG